MFPGAERASGSFSSAGHEAREGRKGLWADPVPISPWEYRASPCVLNQRRTARVICKSMLPLPPKVGHLLELEMVIHEAEFRLIYDLSCYRTLRRATAYVPNRSLTAYPPAGSP